jgi:hypothetical protein
MKTKKRTLQVHSEKRIHEDKNVTAEQTLVFLHEFQLLHQGEEGPSKLISIRVPERLLKLFRAKAERQGKRYQTEILRLMRESLERT